MGPKFPCVQYTCTERNVNKTYLFQQWLEVSLRSEWGQWPPLSCLGLPVFWEDQGTWHWDWIRQVWNIQKLYIYPNLFRHRDLKKKYDIKKKYTNTCIKTNTWDLLHSLFVWPYLQPSLCMTPQVFHKYCAVLPKTNKNSIPFLPISLK